MKRPCSVRIGGREIAIHWLSEKAWMAHPDRDDEADGEMYWGRGEIWCRTRKGQAAWRKREILLHEIIHCCWSYGDVNRLGTEAPPEIFEERAVSILGILLTTVLQDNPAVAAYLTEAS